MKASKFTNAQKAFLIKQGEEGATVSKICRKAGISQVTYFNWKKKYAGMLPTDMKRLRELEDENSRLKKVVADLALDKEMLQDVLKRKLGGLLEEESWTPAKTYRNWSRCDSLIARRCSHGTQQSFRFVRPS